MSKKFEFVNIEGGVCHDISRTVMGMAARGYIPSLRSMVIFETAQIVMPRG
jgi:hypothetical protein